MRILLIEDDAPLAAALMSFLETRDFVCECADSLAAARALLPAAHWAAVLLDWQLPDGEGLSLLPTLRRNLPDSPVIMLTARDQISDRIRGLDAGADDYLVKPIDLHELAARLRALVRRAHGQSDARLSAGAVELDPAAHQVWLAGAPVELSGREYDLLHALLLSNGRVLSREQLEQRLYQWGSEINSNAVEVHIYHLRRKLGAGLIETVRGVGYRMAQGATA